jgi:2-polyprenyl-3-methyl-5-hydroxy-6-metoxy-1,4-benzoquinol methylase
MECIRCPLCDASQEELLFRRADFAYQLSDDEFRVVRCRKCDIVYVNPRPTETEIREYYPPQFYGEPADPTTLLREKQSQLLLKYEYVKHLPPGRLLDIGCTRGEFMYFMREHGWDVHGVEFSAIPPNVFQLDIFTGELERAGHPPASFDLVTLWAVLEHVYDPRQTLSLVNRLLRPGGKAVVLVTNFRSLPARLMRHDDIPRHTTLFTKRTLHQMLKRTGFRPESFRFNCELFGGNNRGVLNYLAKLAAGESIAEIVAQNRTVSRWHEFSSQLHGMPSQWMLTIDHWDRVVTPFLDRWLDRLHLGFIMIATASRD